MYKDFFASCKETDEVVWMLKGAIQSILEMQPKDSIYKITNKQSLLSSYSLTHSLDNNS